MVPIPPISFLVMEALKRVILHLSFSSLLMCSIECLPLLLLGVLSLRSYLGGILSKVRSLLFADDTIIFCKSNRRDITNFKLILYLFEQAYGLGINLSKSSLVYFGKHSSMPHFLSSCLNFSTETRPVKYLGLPSNFGRLTREIFSLSLINSVLNLLVENTKFFPLWEEFVGARAYQEHKP